MTSLPNYRPKQLSLGPLEAEILSIVWELEKVTVKDVHDRILNDPDRELAYASVTTVLRRLTEKGWLICDKTDRVFSWQPSITRSEAKMLQAQEHLQEFLANANPDMVAAFADRLDRSSLEQLEAIALRLLDVRKSREEQK